MRVLIVEDEPNLGRQLRSTLEGAGYAVDLATDGEDGHYLGSTENYDAVILDLGLPEVDGLTVLDRWRKEAKKMPVLVLTARDSWSDKVAGLDAGADDYLVKPFDLDELSARVRAVARRRAGRAESVVRIGELEIDAAARVVRWKGGEVSLSPREYALLEALANRPGAYLTRAQLEERLYGWDEEIASNAVEVHIHALRRKLDPELIRNVRGMGYTIAKAH
jgi:two-component system OmpR family response regulator